MKTGRIFSGEPLSCELCTLLCASTLVREVIRTQRDLAFSRCFSVVQQLAISVVAVGRPFSREQCLPRTQTLQQTTSPRWTCFRSLRVEPPDGVRAALIATSIEGLDVRVKCVSVSL